jgi:hypothetical protein
MKFRLIALVAVALVSAKAAHAGVAFDTINYGTPVNFSGLTSDGTKLAGQSFTTSSQLDFASISISMLANNPSDGGSVMVYLAADDGSGGGVGTAGAPDLGNIELIGTIPDSMIADESTVTPSVITFFDVANALSTGTADQEYWVILDFSSKDSSAEWIYNADATGIGTDNQIAFTSAYGGTYPIDGSAGPGAFALMVNTPEPATVALLGSAMAGLGFLRRRRKKTTG